MVEKKLYVKDQSFDPIYKTVNKPFYFKSRVFPGVLLGLGFFILATQVIYPLVYIKTNNEITKPVASTVLGIASGFSEFEFSELEKQNGPVSPDQQVLGTSSKKNDTVTPEYFYLTIPKLKIEKALIETNAGDLKPDDALGHYKGSSLPGETGNSFIFGHSVLPWFYNPKNYKTIFSTLDDLNVGDTFTIEYAETTYSYKIAEKIVLPTEKVKPLGNWRPKYLNESTMTLMTCWPAGTKAKRLLINAIAID